MTRTSRILLALVALSVLVTALAPIRSWDYFWHLSTGAWILDHSALPSSDPFSIGTDETSWINGSWLFQVIVAGLHRLGSHQLVSITRAVSTVLLMCVIFVVAIRRCDEWIALLLVSLAAWGAWVRLDARPETAGISCAAIAVIVLQRRMRYDVLLYGAVAVLWINLHPSALLAPLFAGLSLVGALIHRSRADAVRAGWATVASAGALLVNPWGVRGLLAPLNLAGMVEADLFVNLEWLPSDPRLFPLLYLVMIAGLALILRDRFKHPFESLLFIVLAVLAARWVRNQGFFFVLMPLALSPLAGTMRVAGSQRRIVAIVAAAALVMSLSPALVQPPGAGVQSERFPTRSARMIEELGLKGNIFNADQFGGFLIWSVYPERRVLIDGRNELYAGLLPRLLRARGDAREWKALLEEYRIDIAVEEHAGRPLEVQDAGTGRTRFASPSLSMFPRREWALVAVDPASMLLVRRASVDESLLERYEYRSWRPDIVGAWEIANPELWEAEKARGELELRTVEPVS